MSLMFKENNRDVVILTGEVEKKEGDNNKSYYVYGIQNHVLGENEFNATEKLHEKIKALNVGKGDSVYITKVNDESFKYPYFKVELPENHASKIEMDKYATGEIKAGDPIDKGIVNFEKQFEKADEKLEKHELFTRVERLEKITAVLWTDYTNRTSDAGHKPGDEEIPF